jgi:LysR family transcriptional activator of nhaA
MESGVQWMAAPDVAESLKKDFPHSLSTTPLLLPTERAAMRRGVDQWLDEQGIHTEIAGEFDDFALMGVFAQGGTGAIAVPTLFEKEAALAFNIERVGEMDGVSVRFFAHCLRPSLQRTTVRAILDADTAGARQGRHLD